MSSAEHALIPNLIPKLDETEIALLDLLDYLNAIEAITHRNETYFAVGRIGSATRQLLASIRENRETLQPTKTI